MLLGFVLAVLIHLSPTLRRAVYPLAIGSQAVPIAVIAPLLVFWWGFGVFPKLFVIVLICFFPVLVTTVDGLAAVDPDQLKLLRTLDASRWQAFRFAELPAALPAAISGARIALTVGVIGAYIAESQTATSGTHAGLGHEINADLTALQTPRAYAAAVLLFALAVACFYALALAERRLAPWVSQSRARQALRVLAPHPARRRGPLLCPVARAGHIGVRGQAGRDLHLEDEALQRDARLLPQRRSRGALLGHRPRELPRGRTGCPPADPGGTG